ncbi:hypothetical protein I317_02202 [Kwoniella heveanensis CBS 569]|nr:hypothetical protein I317_02202 [Kwoniella heveanensis CBS 569]
MSGRTQAQNQDSPTPSNGSTLTVSGGKGIPTRRRPKPPSPDLDEGSGSGSPTLGAGGQKRFASGAGAGDSPSTLPRPRLANGPGSGIGHGLPTGAQGHRTILRQPSTPLLTADRDRRSPSGPVGATTRPRALSSASASAQRQIIVRKSPMQTPSQAITQTATDGTRSAPGPIAGAGSGSGMRSLPSQKLFESSFLEHREPPVPPHIRVRLRLIHQLGVVLGIDAVGISGKIDIPGLLARVDQAYDRERFTAGSNCSGNSSSGAAMAYDAGGGMSALPVPRGKNGLNGGAGASGGGASGAGGVLGLFRRLGKKGSGDDAAAATGGFSPPTPPEGPAFGVSLSEAPPGSWCTSLIGGQKHELPLVVFTVVEEIYRRGMSQPGIFRLAGDGVRISSLTKVFNLPPLYGDSLPISGEPIHNLTGLVKRYVRDLPEPILDESLFPAFMAFCVGDQDEPQDPAAAGDDVKTKDSNDNKDEQAGEPGAVEEANTKTTASLSRKITAAQILLKLLPPLHFSLFIYLLAFLGQLPLFPDNRLNIESISIIFGPAMCAARNKGISGLGPTVSSSKNKDGYDPEEVSELVGKSQSVLAWLLRNWGAISEKVLEEDEPTISGVAVGAGMSLAAGGGGEGKERDKGKSKKDKTVIDPRLLSPIDLRGSSDTARARKPDSTVAGNAASSVISAPKVAAGESPPSAVAAPISRATSTNSSTTSSSPDMADLPSPASTIVRTPGPAPPAMGIRKSSSHSALKKSASSTGFHGLGLRSSPSSNTVLGLSMGGSGSGSGASGGVGSGMKSSTSSGGGLFARALSSMSISSQAEDRGGPGMGSGYGGVKGPKRSASFTSLSSLVKKVGKDHKSHPMPTRSMSDDTDNARPAVNPQITTVLGSLHDLLVNKDKQIERDARELALLRHTLLEMDEKLQRATLASPLPGPVGINGCTCPVHPNATSPMASSTSEGEGHAQGEMPEITITSTPSSSTLPISPSLNMTNSLNKEIIDLQTQLSTALAALETTRLSSRKQAERTLILEARISRAESEKRLEVSKLEVALALEQARCVGLVEERDLARERLEKVKTTLFSVA